MEAHGRCAVGVDRGHVKGGGTDHWGQEVPVKETWCVWGVGVRETHGERFVRVLRASCIGGNAAFSDCLLPAAV
jgi:hypothetical protein